MSARSIELREKRGRLASEAQLLIPPDGQKISAEKKQKFDLIMVEVDQLRRDIDCAERAEAARLGLGDERERWNELDADLRQTRRPPEAQIGTDGFDEALAGQSERRYQRAFTNFLRHGLHRDQHFRGLDPEDLAVLRSRERRDMAEGVGSTGGFLVPTGFVYQLEAALKWYGSMLEAADTFDTSTGQSLPWPTSDDTNVSGEQVDENAIVSTNDVTVGQVVFGAFKYSTKLVKCSIELLQDSAFDIDNFLKEAFAIRLGRILNNKFTVGVGTTEPKGIVVAASSGVAAASGSAANTGGSETGATTLGSNDFVELEHSVDVAYRRGAAYMMHDTTLKGLKEILDKYGRPLWKPGLAAGSPDLINGYPFFINNDMAAIAASAKSVLFGQLKKYKIRRVRPMSILRLTERFAEYGQVAFIGFARYDGNLLDAGTKPVKYLVQHS